MDSNNSLIRTTCIWFKYVSFGFVLGVLGSCERPELPIEPHKCGEVTTSSVDIGIDYRYQVFYDLGTNSEVSRNLKTAWDIAMESSEDGYHLVLNTSKAMQVFHINTINFDQTLDIPTSGWRWDLPDGTSAGTAIGEWASFETGELVSKKKVYVIDLGFDYSGTHLGYKKLVIVSLLAGEYTIRYADLNGDNTRQVSVLKDRECNFSFFSFDSGQAVKIEPPIDQWDLEFTQYTHIFYDNPESSFYLVTGVLQNRHSTKVEVDSITSFSEFGVNNIERALMRSEINTIGYSWKEYNFDTGNYGIYTHKNYLIMGEQGYYYKLHFIDFYNDSGEKGTPKFEFQKL